MQLFIERLARGAMRWRDGKFNNLWRAISTKTCNENLSPHSPTSWKEDEGTSRLSRRVTCPPALPVGDRSEMMSSPPRYA